MLKPSLCAHARGLPMHARVDTNCENTYTTCLRLLPWKVWVPTWATKGHRCTDASYVIAPAVLKFVKQVCSVHVAAYGRKRESQAKKDLKRQLQRTSDIKQFEEEYRRAPEQYQLPCRLANLEDAELASVAVSALQKSALMSIGCRMFLVQRNKKAVAE